MSEEQSTPPPAPGEAAPEGTPPAVKQGMTESTWAMLTHLAGLLGMVFPYGNIVGPLIIWIIKKDEMPVVDRHGKEAVNFQISASIYITVGGFIAGILVAILIGIPLLILVGIAWIAFVIVFPIIAGLKANEGKDYRYPMTIRFIK